MSNFFWRCNDIKSYNSQFYLKFIIRISSCFLIFVFIKILINICKFSQVVTALLDCVLKKIIFFQNFVFVEKQKYLPLFIWVIFRWNEYFKLTFIHKSCEFSIRLTEFILILQIELIWMKEKTSLIEISNILYFCC
jgi:hypothetical protein